MLMVDGGLRGAPPHTPHATTVLTATVLKGAARRAPHTPRATTVLTATVLKGAARRAPHTPRATTVLTATVLKGAARRAPPSPPRYDRSEGHPSGADAHFSMTRSLTSGFSFSRRSAGTVTVAASPSLTNRSWGCLSNHASHEARSRSRTWMRGRRIGSKPRANGERAAPPATMRIASCSYAVPLALPRSAHATSRG